MNLRDLEYLSAVAEHLHFGKAAQACHVSQPTLSMQLKKLEEYLGVQLFERDNKHVLLTATGHSMVQHAREALRAASAMRELARHAADPLSGDLRLGIFPTLGPYALPALVPLIRGALPKINLLLTEEKTPTLLTQLSEGTLDCALLALPVNEAGLEAAPLFTEPFLLAVPAAHKLANKKAVQLVDLRHENLLLLEEGHCLRAQALEVCEMLGIGESSRFRATSLETLRHMVAAGGAVTLMPKMAAGESALVRYLPIRPAPSRSIGLVWRARSARAPLYAALAKALGKLKPCPARTTTDFS